MSGRERSTLVAAILGLSVTILDETIVFIALPAIERDLAIGLSGQQWVVNGYLLTLSALLLPAGALADRYGRRRLFVLGLWLFGAATLAAALAPSGAALIAARLAQGLGAALVMPSTLALLTACFRGEARGGAIGSWAAWGGVAAAIAPLVGGLVIPLNWRWIFLLGLPLVGAAIAIARWRVPESREDPAARTPLDLAGAALAAAFLGGLSFALIQGPEVGWSAPEVRASALLAPLALVAFLVRERRARAPMIPLSLFRVRNFSAANGATLALYGVFNGNFFILLIYLQTALDYSALAAGLATVPVTLLMLALASRFGRLGERIGPRRPMTLGLVLVAGGLGLLALLEPGEGYLLHVLPGVLLFGLGLAMTVAPLTDAAVSALPDERGGIASGVNNAAARVAALLAVALLGLVFAAVFRETLAVSAPSPPEAASLERARERPTAALEGASTIGPGARSLRPALEEASVAAYRAAMGAGVVLALLGAGVALGGVKDPPGRPSTLALLHLSTAGRG